MFSNLVKWLFAQTSFTAADKLVQRKTSVKRVSAKTYPHSSAGEAARRARQIAKGQLTRANGLVWPGQLISRPDGKLYLQHPYC